MRNGRGVRGIQALIVSLTLAGAAGRAGVAADAGAAPDVATLLRRPDLLVDLLRRTQPDVAAAAARADRAAAGVGSARLHPNPTLNASLANIPLGETNPPGLGSRESLIWSLGVAQTVELGKRVPRIASARAQDASARESWLDEIGERTAEARNALGRVVEQRARQELLEEALRGARSEFELEEAREQGGDLAGNDLDRLQLDLFGLEADVARARAELDGALATCRALLAIPCDAGSASLADLEDRPKLPAATANALANTPPVRALAQDERAATFDEQLARRRRIPDPTLGIAYVRDWFTVSGDNPRSWQASVTLGLPLFDRGQHDAARAAARAREAAAARNALLARARSAVAELDARRTFLETTLRQLAAETVPRSKQILETTQKALDQGEASMTDLLLARRTHTSILLNQLELRYELFTVTNELRRLFGLDADLARAAAPAPAGENG